MTTTKVKIFINLTLFSLLILITLFVPRIVSAQGCGERCWFPPDTTHCDPGLTCAPGVPPETRVCWGEICAGDPTPTPTNTPTPTATPTPTPTPAPCQLGLSTKYKCNEDETAQVIWMWDSRYAAVSYRLQISKDRDFDPLDTETLQIAEGNTTGRIIGATEYYTNFSVNNPSTMRYCRVIVYESGNRGCETEGEWIWSNVTSTSVNCSEGEGGENEPPPANFLDNFFCNSSGQAVDDPQSGEIFTAIGCVPSSELQKFAEFSLGWSIGIGGGIVLLLIVYAGYLYTTSQGNPQKVQAAKELITAAVGGLLFLIFSATIMRIIYSSLFNLGGCVDIGGNCVTSEDCCEPYECNPEHKCDLWMGPPRP